MPAFTSRLNLYKPGDGVNISPDEAADIDKLNDNADIIDDAVGAKIVTSGTRPASPYQGQVVFETDTGDLRVRSGSTWAMANRSDRSTWNVADLTALAALSGSSIVKDGDLCTVQEGSVLYARIAGVWVQQTTATFATTAARNTAYAKASAAYRVARARSRVTTELADRVYNGSAWKFEGGLVPVLPTSVAGTGVTLDAATGLVTFTASPTASVNGCFTSEFDDYFLVLDYVLASAFSPSLLLRVAGVDSIVSYDNQRLSITGAAAVANQTLNTNAIIPTGGVGAAAAARVVSELKIFSPAKAEATYGTTEALISANPMVAGSSVYKGGFLHRPLTAYDGFSLDRGGGTTLTGTARIYGYN